MFKKFNWGHGVAVVLGSFIIFIVYFVYKTIALPEYDHQLVSEEYYKDEMVYQQELNRLDNAKSLKENLKIVNTNQGIEIIFPSFLDAQKISGTIEMQRPENSKWDIHKPIVLNNFTSLIPANELHKGNYNAKIIWHYDNISYQMNHKINYQ